MKLKSITIENIKSFNDKTTIEFDKNLNILIGPNGEGKSNLLDIITQAIRRFTKMYCTTSGGNEQTEVFKAIQQVTFPFLNTKLEKFAGNESSASLLEVVFEVTKEDIDNINEIKSKKEIFKKNLEKYKNGSEFVRIIESVYLSLEKSSLQEGVKLKYTISNPNDQMTVNSNFNSNEEAYLSYLNNLELFLILLDEKVDLKPSYLYFSPYRIVNASNLQTNLSNLNYYQLYQNYAGSTSRSIGNSPIELASFYFAQKKRKLEVEAKDNGYNNQWEEDEGVKLVNCYFSKLGYKWDIYVVDLNKNIYEMSLEKDGRKFLITQASSGEKEIFNLLLSIVALNVRDGLIIIDEPELHLHPKWQRLLMDLFIELSTKTSIQFIIATHSGIFINEKTISNVIRVYRDDTGTSKVVKIKEKNLPEIKDLLHIINSLNNEKLFFADKVVLVEGITDRIFFKKLIEECKPESGNSEVVEVLEVQGKGLFSKYKRFLKEIGCKYYIIADFDYIRDLASEEKKEEIKALFVAGKIDELKDYIEEKEKENIFILYCKNKKCEIEDFLPDDHKNKNKNLDTIIKLTKNDKFKEKLYDSIESEKKERLEKIVDRILKN